MQLAPGSLTGSQSFRLRESNIQLPVQIAGAQRGDALEQAYSSFGSDVMPERFARQGLGPKRAMALRRLK
jgi:hypothetical protein